MSNNACDFYQFVYSALINSGSTQMNNLQIFGFTTLISLIVAPAVAILSFFIVSPFSGWAL